MTALCPGGGPSQEKPGVDPLITLSSIAVAAALDSFGLEAVSLVLSPIISLVQWDIGTFCVTDPPPDPGLTAQDLVDVTNYTDPTVSIPAIKKCQQWFASRYWYVVCECVGGGTPAPPALSNPGPVGQDTGLPSGTANDPCTTALLSGDSPPGTGMAFGGQTNLVDIFEFSNPPAGNQQTSVTVDGTNFTSAQFPGPIPGFNLRVRWRSPSTGVQVTNNHNIPAGSTQVHVVDVSPGGDYIMPGTVDFIGDGSTGTFLATWTLRMWCNGADPNGFASPCCPPDPLLEGKLNQILGMLMELSAGSQGGPVRELTDGVRHAGLTGNGTLLLSAQPLAVRVEVNPPQPAWPHNPGSPSFYFSMGYITSYAAGNPLRGWRLVYQAQVFPLATYAEEIGYTLPPGISVDIVEQLAAGA